MQIMREDGKEGNIPKYCLYRHFEGIYIYIAIASSTCNGPCCCGIALQLDIISIVHADYTKETEEQLTVKKGDIVGLVEEDDFDVFWKVRR